MGKMNQFYVNAFVIVILSMTYYEAKFWQESVPVSLFFPISLCDKNNDQSFVMLFFVSEHLKISWSLQMSNWNPTISLGICWL